MIEYVNVGLLDGVLYVTFASIVSMKPLRLVDRASAMHALYAYKNRHKIIIPEICFYYIVIMEEGAQTVGRNEPQHRSVCRRIKKRKHNARGAQV